MILATPLAIQATAYWRNSKRLCRPTTCLADQLEHMNAFAVMQHMATMALPSVAMLARYRCDALHTRLPYTAKIYAFPTLKQRRVS